jgi:hypothetical protein
VCQIGTGKGAALHTVFARLSVSDFQASQIGIAVGLTALNNARGDGRQDRMDGHNQILAE